MRGLRFLLSGFSLLSDRTNTTTIEIPKKVAGKYKYGTSTSTWCLLMADDVPTKSTLALQGHASIKYLTPSFSIRRNEKVLLRDSLYRRRAKYRQTLTWPTSWWLWKALAGVQRTQSLPSRHRHGGSQQSHLCEKDIRRPQGERRWYHGHWKCLSGRSQLSRASRNLLQEWSLLQT